MKTVSKTILYFAGCLVFAGCGGGGGEDSELLLGGQWEVEVHLSANGCPSAVPILSDLEYVHDVFTTPDPAVFNSVLLVDDKGDTFANGETPRESDSFIVTGQSHPLNPFVDKFNCTETIVWSYFDIKEDSRGVFTNNVGRNSEIDCTSGTEEVHCNVYYTGSATRRPS